MVIDHDRECIPFPLSGVNISAQTKHTAQGASFGVDEILFPSFICSQCTDAIFWEDRFDAFP